jgi:branched-chain amino acid transport system substrate-binding protein
MFTNIKPRFSPWCKLALVLLLAACVRSEKADPMPTPEWVTGPLPPIGETLSQFAESVSSTLEEAGKQDASSSGTVSNMKVAVLLPLSGKSADVGKQMLDAASLGVVDASVARGQKTSVVLIPKDTSTSPTIAQNAANEAIAQGAEMIIGPLFSQSVLDVAKVATPKHVPVLALTNNRQVAQTGVHVFGFAPEDQVKRISDYALMQDMGHIALLAPNDMYGQVVTNALKANLSAKGGVLTASENYGKRSSNMVAAAKRLQESYRLQPFKALMIADTITNSELLLKSLKEQGLDLSNITLLGTALWEDGAITPISPLVGGLYATTDPKLYSSFTRRFNAVYGYEPRKIASLTYDAVRLLAERGKNIQGNGLGMATGAYKINASGITERNLAVMRFTSTGTEVVSPALKMMESAP